MTFFHQLERAPVASPPPQRASGVLGSATLSRRACLGAACVLLLPSSLQAADDRKVIRYNRDVPGSSLKAGAARGSIAAPTSQVQAVVTDYVGYSRFIKGFEHARVVGRTANATDLYFEIPILGGLTKVWAILRFGPPSKLGQAVVISGRMLKGNAKRLDVTWRIQNLKSQRTQLESEILFDIKFPAPRSQVLKTVRRAAAHAVQGARGEAEQRRSGRG